MATASSCQIQLFVGSPPLDDVHSALIEAGYDLGVRDLHEPALPAHLCIVDGGRQTELALERCRRLRLEQSDGFTPILFVTADAQARLAGLASGADTTLGRPFVAEELLAQLQALLHFKN